MRRIIAGLVVLSLLGLAVLAGAWLHVQKQFDAPGPLVEETTLVIPRGAGLNAIARLLAEEGIIEAPWVFVAGARLDRDPRPLRAGEYAFPAGVSARGARDILISGKVVMHRLTVPEGLTTRQVLALVAENRVLEGPITRNPPEGALLPETYHFPRGESRDAVIVRMQRAMDETLDELWPARAPDLPLGGPEEALVLASIVEKETGLASERPRVAAVFINRLRRGMRLQSDPTVIYGLAGGEGGLGSPLTRADLAEPTPYNTYVIDALPPGPIANPGRESIAAVLNPLETDEYYFVADGTGGHAFARTLQEHNRNVAQWRRIQRERRAQDEAR